MNHELESHFCQSYGGFADKRCKLFGAESLIRVDDRDELDRAPGIHGLFVQVMGAGEFTLRMFNLPIDEHVRACLAKLKADLDERDSGNEIELRLNTRSAGKLRRLSTAVRRVVGRGRRYSNRNWKWMAPRAGESLAKLAQVLDEFNAVKSA